MGDNIVEDENVKESRDLDYYDEYYRYESEDNYDNGDKEYSDEHFGGESEESD